MDPAITTLINIGVAGVILVLFIRGDLVNKSTYEREIRRGDTATEATAKTAEALRSATDVMSEVSKIGKDNNALIKENNQMLEKILATMVTQEDI
jgi:hypothetical protein